MSMFTPSLNLISLMISLMISLTLPIHTGCQNTLYGLNEDLTALEWVHVKVEGDPTQLVDPETRSRLRVGVVWAGINFPDEWCLTFLDELLNLGRGLEGSTNDDSLDSDDDQQMSIFDIDLNELEAVLSICRDPFGFAPSHHRTSP